MRLRPAGLTVHNPERMVSKLLNAACALIVQLVLEVLVHRLLLQILRCVVRRNLRKKRKNEVKKMKIRTWKRRA